jgi:two-component system, OmpR family, heavy metal sensor histidine kinase CusS
MRSIRRALSLPLLIGVVLLVGASGLVSSRLVTGQLRRDFDQALLDKARALATLADQEDGEMEMDFVDELMPEFSVAPRREYFELWTAGGAVVRRSKSLGEENLPRSQALTATPRLSDLRLPDGRPGRLVEISFEPLREDETDLGAARESVAALPPALGGQHAVLVLARGRDLLERLVAEVVLTYLGVAALLALAITVLVRGVLSRGLRPLTAVAAAVAAIDTENLAQRLTLTPAVAELAPIVDRLNGLLTVLEEAFARERRFSADVAHELRTPVAELRSLAEVGRRWPGETKVAAAFFTDALAIAEQMEQVVEQLLALARAEAGLEPIASGPVVVAELMERAWAGLAREAAARGLRGVRRVPPRMVVATDRDKLALILGNLLENAVRYSPRGAEIEFSAAEDAAGGWQLALANPAPHLEAADLSRVFDRFWRKDPARSDGRHAGLGLPLVRSLARLLGIEVSAELAPDHVLTVRLAGPGVAPTKSPRQPELVPLAGAAT